MFRVVATPLFLYPYLATMAENKKSFLLYADLIHTVKKLPEEEAGKLFKLILSYVNDEKPNIDEFELVIQIAFEPIKRQLKRDLEKYKEKQKQWSEAGKLSAKARKDKKKKRPLTTVKDRSTDLTVTVNDNVTVNDIIKKGGDFLNVVYFEKSKDVDEAFKDYLKLRMKHKYTMTDRAVNALVNKLREISGGNKDLALKIIDNAILGKWKSFYSDKKD